MRTTALATASIGRITEFSDKRSGSRIFAVSTTDEEHVTQRTSQNIKISPDISYRVDEDHHHLCHHPCKYSETQYLAYIESVACGFGTIELSCRVKVETTQQPTEKHMFFC